MRPFEGEAFLICSDGLSDMVDEERMATLIRAEGGAAVTSLFDEAMQAGGRDNISIILVQSATAFAIVKYLGAAYLCWIGLKALHDAFRGVKAAEPVVPARRRRTLINAFGEGLLTNALNPKVSMFYLAAFPQFIPAGDASATAAFVLVLIMTPLAALAPCCCASPGKSTMWATTTARN